MMILSCLQPETMQLADGGPSVSVCSRTNSISKLRAAVAALASSSVRALAHPAGKLMPAALIAGLAVQCAVSADEWASTETGAVTVISSPTEDLSVTRGTAAPADSRRSSPSYFQTQAADDVLNAAADFVPATDLVPVTETISTLRPTPSFEPAASISAGRIQHAVSVASNPEETVSGVEHARLESGLASANAKPFFELTDSANESEATSDLATISTSNEQIVRGMIWLVIVLCLFCLTLLGLRRWQRSRGLLPVNNGRSRVLETLSLGPGRTVSLIEMNGVRAFVGSDAGGIRTIVLAPPSFHDEMSAADPEVLITSANDLRRPGSPSPSENSQSRFA